MATNSELKPCPTIGSKCRGCPDCPCASSTGFKSGEITNEAARQELESLDYAQGQHIQGERD